MGRAMPCQRYQRGAGIVRLDGPRLDAASYAHIQGYPLSSGLTRLRAQHASPVSIISSTSTHTPSTQKTTSRRCAYARVPPSSISPSSDSHTASTRTASRRCALAGVPLSAAFASCDTRNASTQTVSRRCAHARAPPNLTSPSSDTHLASTRTASRRCANAQNRLHRTAIITH